MSRMIISTCDISMPYMMSVVSVWDISMCMSHMTYWCHTYRYEAATISRLLKSIGFNCRILSLLQGSFVKETCNFKKPDNRSHPILGCAISVCPDDTYDICLMSHILIYHDMTVSRSRTMSGRDTVISRTLIYQYVWHQYVWHQYVWHQYVWHQYV